MNGGKFSKDRPALIYLDNNVISAMADGGFPFVRHFFANDDVAAVYSDMTISDMQDATSIESQIALLDQLKAWRIFPSASDKGCTLDPSRAVSEVYQDSLGQISTQQFEHAVDKFSVFAHEGKSEHNSPDAFDQLGKNLLKSIGGLFQEQSLELDANLMAQLETVFQAPSPPLISVAKQDGSDLTKLKSRISGIKPPDVIGKFLAYLPEIERKSFASKFRASDENYSALVEAVTLLGLLGFGTDTRIKKERSDIALKGAKSERLDVQHIGFALHCEMFITNDTRTSRKAFALAEYMDYHCIVARLNNQGLARVSSNNW